METLLPPLSALRAFEAAARHQSYTRAADELHMTQAAVSYQIKALETRLGVALFRRQGRHVVLTDTGERLGAAVVDAFSRLRRAVGAEVAQAQEVLSITALPTIAGNWLAPRLGEFQIAHPSLAVRIDTSIVLADIADGAFDVGLRVGVGPWPGLTAHRLMQSTYTAVCAPETIAARRLKKPADLLRMPLYGRPVWWHEWFRTAGVPETAVSRMVEMDLGVQSFEVKAALANGGAAMISPAFFADDLASGRLVPPFAVEVREAASYWLVYASARAASPKIAAFRQWLLGLV
ncbi:LysR substrate-binding domain-containing protein [Tahibacter soli]|jgi:LysR family glycine cleavage system transcriptional activator|uniref:LysR substrate-binding domain-containing protein n=1 Tax=Tahibacter soli TaxID=2983605 RepID=A0A9X4BJH1_9GAMM|nr:LysR substrate-binding domain-containing protein [Tahibacter soli]MDC8013257.1 LysR substrate-binding domain-containing protein [Tahibacter soli]